MRRQLVIRAAVTSAVVLAVVVVFVLGRSSVGSSTPAPAPAAAPAAQPGAWQCPTVVDHSAQGAATTAMVGLYSMATVDLQSSAATPTWSQKVEDLLTRYVVPEQRAAMRQYLSTTQSTLTTIAETPVVYQVVSYSDTQAVVRLLVVDYGRQADGQSRADAGVILTTLDWDAPSSHWRLASWPADNDPTALTSLLAGAGSFCHVAG